MKIIVYLLAIIIVVLLGILAFVKPGEEPIESQILSFEDCIAAGYPVMESYPRQCAIPNGKSFTENIGNIIEKTDLIRITDPQPNSVLISPLTIRGEARGTWYFEASFPVSLLDANGNKIPTEPGFIQAKSDWMTENFVPFEAVLTFTKPTTATGTLILHKDNPSGLPEHDDQLLIPVRF